MSERSITKLSDERGHITKEAALAVMIVAALMHDGYMPLPDEAHDSELHAAIRLVARLLQDRVMEDYPPYPLEY